MSAPPPSSTAAITLIENDGLPLAFGTAYAELQRDTLALAGELSAEDRAKLLKECRTRLVSTDFSRYSV
jgi:hypothetical protein